MARALRLAVLAQAISHFEVPLFRLCGQAEDLALKVFYVLPVKTALHDSEFGQSIEWGFPLLAGYEAERVATTADLPRAALNWGADVMLLYGYGFPGASRIILRNWWQNQAQIHRGTLNFHLDPRRPLKGRLMRPLRNLLLRLFHAHHYGGSYSRKVLLDAGIDPKSLFFVPYSVDTPHFAAAADDAARITEARALRQLVNAVEGDSVLLFIAQHNWFKGPDIALRVFERVAALDQRVSFLVVGSGRMTEDMKSYARDHLRPDRIHFAGYVPSAQTVSYYLASDLVLCSSRYETWARMANEAMLCRRPCVLSRVVPAAGGLVDDGQTGYVVDRPEVELFAGAIARHLALSRTARQRMGEAARERALQFAYEPHAVNVLAAANYALAKVTGREAAGQ